MTSRPLTERLKQAIAPGFQHMIRRVRIETIRLRYTLPLQSKTVRRDVRFLLSELDRMDVKYESLIEVLKEIVADLGDRWKQADERWDREADMYAQGEAAAYDYAEYRLIEVLKRVGVTTE